MVRQRGLARGRARHKVVEDCGHGRGCSKSQWECDGGAEGGGQGDELWQRRAGVGWKFEEMQCHEACQRVAGQWSRW